MGQRVTVLVLDAFQRKALAVVRGLGEAGHRVTAADAFGPGAAFFSRHVRRRLRSPSPLRDPEGYVAWVARTARRLGCRVVLPLEDRTLEVLLPRRDRLPKDVALPFPPWGIWQGVRDKGLLLDAAQRAGVAVPDSLRVRDGRELLRAAERIPGPWVWKPCRGTGARGLHYLSGPGDLRRAAGGCRPIPGGYVLQEKIPSGTGGIGVSVLFSEGKLLARFTHKRLRELPVTGGAGTLRESIRDPLLEAAAERLLREAGWRDGVAMVEFRHDPRTNRYLLLEVNARFWGSLDLALRAGVNFPDLLCRAACGLRPTPVHSYPVGVRSRWLLPGDILARCRGAAPVAPGPGPCHTDEWRRDDPMPLLGTLLAGWTYLTDRTLKEFLAA